MGSVAGRSVPAGVGKLVASELHRPHHAYPDKGGLATFPHELAQVPARLHGGVRKRRPARRCVEGAEKMDESLGALHIDKQLEVPQAVLCLQRRDIAERVGQVEAFLVADVGAEGDLDGRVAEGGRYLGDPWCGGRFRNRLRAG